MSEEMRTFLTARIAECDTSIFNADEIATAARKALDEAATIAADTARQRDAMAALLAALPAPEPAPEPEPQPSPEPGPAPTPTPTPTPIADTAKAGEQPGVKTAPIRMDVPPPSKRQGTRGGQTLYDFDKLEVGGSFGVFDKTAKAVASTVASANKRYVEEVKDDKGAVIMIPDPKKAGATMPLTKVTKKFVSAATDPATDPDKAPVRVWRIAV